MLCAFCVPAHITIGEFHSFVGGMMENVTHLQVMRNVSTRYSYSVLIRFKDSKSAAAFRARFDGMRYNSLEDDVCEVAFLDEVVFDAAPIAPCPEFQIPSMSDLATGEISHPGTPILNLSRESSGIAVPSLPHGSRISRGPSRCSDTDPIDRRGGASGDVDADGSGGGGGAGGGGGGSSTASSTESGSMTTASISVSTGATAAPIPQRRIALATPTATNNTTTTATASSTMSPSSTTTDSADTSCISNAPPRPASAASIESTLSTHSLRLGEGLHVFAREDETEVCPVCLDPIDPDEIPAITILCNHSFHFNCISKWADSTCPVCRFVMQPAVPSECEQCRALEDLWICLVCGNVGCGRYSGGHAVDHFEQTDHSYALDVNTRRVWDYVEDEFVHRLIAHKRSQKLTGMSVRDRLYGDRAIPSGTDTDSLMSRSGRAANRLVRSSGDEYSSLKLEELMIEYNYLLSSQLETQRLFFQQQLEMLERDKGREVAVLQYQLKNARTAANRKATRLADLKVIVSDTTADVKQLHQDINNVASELQAVEKENRSLRQTQQNHSKHLSDLKVELKQEYENKRNSLDEQLADMRQQIGDFEYHFKSTNRLGSEAVGAQILFAADASGNDHKVEYSSSAGRSAAMTTQETNNSSASITATTTSGKKKRKKKKKKKKKKRKVKSATATTGVTATVPVAADDDDDALSASADEESDDDDDCKEINT
jgi:Zn-finger in ubiquitin-hydrolases and other protein/BRCA1-associated protein 2/Ring finger domain